MTACRQINSVRLFMSVRTGRNLFALRGSRGRTARPLADGLRRILRRHPGSRAHLAATQPGHRSPFPCGCPDAYTMINAGEAFSGMRALLNCHLKGTS